MEAEDMARRPRRSVRHSLAEQGYKVILDPLKEGGFQVIAPALPGIVTYGRSLREARAMARDAVVCHLRGLLKDGEEIPRGRQ